MRETELAREREQLQIQIAEASILVRLRQSEEGEEGGEGAVLEKYYEARRELETLRQKISMEYEDEIEQLSDSKRSLEKKVGGAVGGVWTEITIMIFIDVCLQFKTRLGKGRSG